MIYLLSQNNFSSSLAAIILLFLVVLSDILDGYIARRKHEVTRFGSFLDPVSDILIVYSLLIFFTLKNSLLLIPLIVFLLRDFSVNFHRFIAAKNDLEIGPDPYKKRGNLLQYLLVFFLGLENLWAYSALSDSFYMLATQGLVFLFLLVAVIYSIASALYYFVKVFKNTI